MGHPYIWPICYSKSIILTYNIHTQKFMSLADTNKKISLTFYTITEFT